MSLDSKGRLAIPSRYRDGIRDCCQGKLVVTVNNTQEHCLWLYPIDEWERVEEKIVSLPSFNPQHQKLKRFLLGHASDVEMDGSGRILLPAPLRDFAMMKRSASRSRASNSLARSLSITASTPCSLRFSSTMLSW